jgi:hypothetical protein
MVTVFAYGAANERLDFVPDLATADAVLLLDAGDAALDARVATAADAALAKRLGSPPRIVERAKGDSVDALKTALRDAVKRAVKALKSGELGQPSGELVAFMLRAVQGRARRAVASGRVPNAEAYGRCSSARWQRVLAVHVLEALVADAGVGALTVAREAKLEPLRVRLEEDIRKAPEDFALGAYED